MRPPWHRRLMLSAERNCWNWRSVDSAFFFLWTWYCCFFVTVSISLALHSCNRQTESYTWSVIILRRRKMLPPLSTRPPINLLPQTTWIFDNSSPGSCRRSGRRIFMMAWCGSPNETFPTPSTSASCARKHRRLYIHCAPPSNRHINPPVHWYFSADGMAILPIYVMWGIRNSFRQL